MLHRVIALSFILNAKNLSQVNHIDGNKQNNRVDNLEWVDSYDNQKHACFVLGKRTGKDCYMTQLTEETVLNKYNDYRNNKKSYISRYG